MFKLSDVTQQSKDQKCTWAFLFIVETIGWKLLVDIFDGHDRDDTTPEGSVFNSTFFKDLTKQVRGSKSIEHHSLEKKCLQLLETIINKKPDPKYLVELWYWTKFVFGCGIDKLIQELGSETLGWCCDWRQEKFTKMIKDVLRNQPPPTKPKEKKSLDRRPLPEISKNYFSEKEHGIVIEKKYENLYLRPDNENINLSWGKAQFVWWYKNKRIWSGKKCIDLISETKGSVIRLDHHQKDNKNQIIENLTSLLFSNGCYLTENLEGGFKSKDNSITVRDGTPVITELSKNLRSVYEDIFKFPEWSLGKDYTSEKKKVVVYYDKNDNEDVVGRLVRQREPVNIERSQCYDKESMSTFFGWEEGYYDTYYQENKVLAPNIGLYTPAVVKNEERDHEVHIYHAIGYAFDNEEQSDYKYFGSREWDPLLITQKYKDVFYKIFLVANDLHMKTIVMSLVGADNFANKYPEGKQALQSLWWEAFEDIRSLYPNISVIFMGGDLARDREELNGYKYIGRFPGNVPENNNPTTLWVNAWDPLSVPGNGNEWDDSLDGFMGRCSNIAVLGTSMTNPYIKFKPLTWSSPVKETTEPTDTITLPVKEPTGPTTNTITPSTEESTEPTDTITLPVKEPTEPTNTITPSTEEPRRKQLRRYFGNVENPLYVFCDQKLNKVLVSNLGTVGGYVVSLCRYKSQSSLVRKQMFFDIEDDQFEFKKIYNPRKKKTYRAINIHQIPVVLRKFLFDDQGRRRLF
jgi:hypothetical protein